MMKKLRLTANSRGTTVEVTRRDAEYTCNRSTPLTCSVKSVAVKLGRECHPVIRRCTAHHLKPQK
jgi:hypothetical protein